MQEPLPNNLSQINEGQIPPVDEKAKQEEKNIVKRSQREGQFDGLIHVIRVIFLAFCAAIVLVVIGCIIYCLLFPNNMHFLPETQKKLNEFFLDSTIGGIIFSFFKSHIIDGKRKD